jgi:hypothetical protein
VLKRGNLLGICWEYLRLDLGMVFDMLLWRYRHMRSGHYLMGILGWAGGCEA